MVLFPCYNIHMTAKDVIVNGNRLKAWRESQQLTQGQLEVKAGISQAHISRLESGDRVNAKLSTVGKLAYALGLPVSELLVEPIAEGELPPIHVFIRQKYGLDELTARSIADQVDLMVTGWRQRVKERIEREGDNNQ